MTTITFDGQGNVLVDGQLGQKAPARVMAYELVQVKCVNPKCDRSCWMYENSQEEWICTDCDMAEESIQLELPL